MLVRHITALVLIAGATTFAAPNEASAQGADMLDDPFAAASESRRLRMKRQVNELANKKGSAPRLVLFPDDNDTGWRVSVEQRVSGKWSELTSIALPPWFGDSHYDYTTQLEKVPGERAWYVVLVATPNAERKPPPGAATMQVAWLVEVPRRGNSRWKYITKAYTSELDGGDSLELTERDGEPALVRYRAQLGQHFCGIRAAEVIEREVYSIEKGIFIVDLDVAALTREAITMQPIIPAGTFEVDRVVRYSQWRSATSDLRTPTDSTTILRPLELGDNDPATVWSEGAPGDGRGEWVTTTIEELLELKGFRIFPGHGASAEEFDRRPQPKSLLVGLSSGQRYIVELPRSSYDDLASRGGLLVEFPSPQPTTCLSVMLLESWDPATPPPKARDFPSRRAYELASSEYTSTTVAEITPVSRLHGLTSSRASKEILAILRAQEDQRKKIGLGLAVVGYSRYLVEMIRSDLSSPQELERADIYMEFLGTLDPEFAVPLLIELLDKIEPQTDAWRGVRRALFAHSEHAADPLMKFMNQLPVDQTQKRIDLIRLFGRVASADQIKALIPGLGGGTGFERDERIRAIALADAAIISDVVRAAKALLDTPAGTDALKVLDAIGHRQTEAAPIVLKRADADALIAMTRKTRQRRTQARLMVLLGHFKPAGADQRLAEILTEERSPLLTKRLAARQLSLFDSEAARDALVTTLDSTSPDLRIEAIKSLMKRDDAREAAEQILAYAIRERWTEGLKPALRFLAKLDSPEVDASLDALVADRDEPERAYLAAQAFERTRRSPSAETIAKVLFEDSTSLAMRRQLLECLAYEETDRGEQLLFDVLANNPFYAQETPRGVERLQIAAMLATGKRRVQRAIPLLLRIVTESEELAQQRAALRALSFYADKDLFAQLTELRKSAPTELDGAFDDALSIIQRRLDLDDAQDSLDQLEEREKKLRERLDKLAE